MKTEQIEFKLAPTTISIKRGTKKELDKIALRRDSYDDVIRRLIKISELYEKIPEKYTKDINRFMILNEEDRASTMLLDDEGMIEFCYKVPILPIRADFRFMITYTKVVYKNKERKIYEIYRGKTEKDRREVAKDYLRIVEKVIRQTIDPLFVIIEKHILDLDWWERQFRNLGLPHGAFKADIEFELLKLGITR